MEFAKSMRGDRMERDGTLSHHTQIHRQCGVCHQTIQLAEYMVSLFSFNGKVEVNDAEFVTSHGYCQMGRCRSVFYCKVPTCRLCPASGETATLHTDCFNLFMKRSTGTTRDKLSRLWVASVATRPWRKCPPLHLPFKNSPKQICETLQIWDIPTIERLPVELQHLIFYYTASHISWRYAVVLEQVDNLSRMERESSTISLRLSDIRSWFRGSSPLVESECDPEASLVRVTIDSSGIKEIIRVSTSEAEVTDAAVSYHELFILENCSKLISVTASFMVC